RMRARHWRSNGKGTSWTGDAENESQLPPRPGEDGHYSRSRPWRNSPGVTTGRPSESDQNNGPARVRKARRCEWWSPKNASYKIGTIGPRKNELRWSCGPCVRVSHCFLDQGFRYDETPRAHLEATLGRPCLSFRANALSRISAAIERPSVLRIAFCTFRTLSRNVESSSTRLIASTKFPGDAWSGEMTTPTSLFAILAATPG